MIEGDRAISLARVVQSGRSDRLGKERGGAIASFQTHTGRIVTAVRARVPLPRDLPEVPPDAPGTLPRQQRAAPERREWLRKLRRAARLFPTNE